ncbi:TPA: adenosine kinase [Candidatus Woesearchaeota archaeon]|nr:adenosine kinase [Candidatus Woesearchaeota archaeon]
MKNNKSLINFEKEFDIYGIGSALIDVLVEVDDFVLENLGLRKGEMKLVNRVECDIVEQELKKYPTKKVPGGSTGNAIVLAAKLGAKCVFCGVVGDDIKGRIYEETMQQDKVALNLGKSSALTGHAITFITPDKQRTFAVHLGAALELDREHISIDDLKKCKILHTEGYLLAEDGSLKDACIAAMDLAKKNEVVVSLDLSAPNIVRNNRAEFREILERYVDVVFANEEEANAFICKNDDGCAQHQDYGAALNELSKICKIAVVKLGKHGSIIKADGKITKIEPFKANAIDTTGAGDAYAAGFLYALCKGNEVEKCGKLGSYLASKVVEKIGARLEKIESNEVKKILTK